MKAKWIFGILAGLALVGAGCQGGKTTASGEASGSKTSEGSTKSGETSTANSGVLGKWYAHMDLGTDKDNPMAGMAEAMGSMMLPELEIMDGGKFKMSMMGIPVEGDWKQEGETLTISPKTVMGMEKDAFEKMQKTKGGNGSMDEDLILKVIDGGKALEAVDKNKSSAGSLIFKREKPASSIKSDTPKEGPSSVAGNESEFVGAYSSKVETTKEPTTDEEKSEVEMVKAMSSSIKLELRKDNSFVLNLMVEMSGKWKRIDNKIQLKPEIVMGMKSDGKNDNEKPMDLEIQGSNLVLLNPEKEWVKLIFSKS